MSRFSRLPVRTPHLLEPGFSLREPRLSRNENRRTRASSTSTGRSSYSMTLSTPSLRRSKSSASLKRTPQSVQGSRIRSADGQRTKKKDDRPIQDKKWQAEMLRKTQEYFHNDPNGSKILNQGKNIRPITINMFIQLVNVILTNIDEGFEELTKINYVELLPKILSRIMYPANVTSSMLKTANTPHNWPHILAILSWLVEFHYFVEESEAFIADNMYALPADIPKKELRDLQILQLQSKTLITAFVKWNKGEESDEIKQFAQNLKSIWKFEYESIENLKHTLEKLSHQKAIDDKKIKTLNDEIEEEENECESFKKNYTYAEEIVAQQKEYLRKLETKIAKYKEDNNKLRAVDEKYKIEILELEQKIEKQTINVEDKDKLLQHIEAINTKKDENIKKREQIQQISDETDLRMSQAKREVEVKASAYNIELFKPALKHPELRDFAIDTDNIWLGSELQKCLKEKSKKSQKFHNELEKRLMDERNSLALIENQNLQRQNEIESLTKENMAVQLKIGEIKSNIQISINNTNQEVNHLTENSRSLQEKISYMKQNFPDEENIKKQLRSKTEEYQLLKTKFINSAHNTLEFFETLEQETINDAIPKYQGIRKHISESLVAQMKMREQKKK